jgi:hypothetical protein
LARKGEVEEEPSLKRTSGVATEPIRCIETSHLLLTGRSSPSEKEEREFRRIKFLKNPSPSIKL